MLLAASGAALADAPAAPASKSADQLLGKALQASMLQVELGKLAQKNADSAGVNALGARLQRDHARIGKVLATMSRDRGVVEPASLDNTQRAQVESLSAKHGADFDAAYVGQMVSDHKHVIALFTAASESSDPDLSGLAKQALPILREDQRLAGSYEKLSPREGLQPVAQQ
jgi:putative membrane protein